MSKKPSWRDGYLYASLHHMALDVPPNPDQIKVTILASKAEGAWKTLRDPKVQPISLETEKMMLRKGDTACQEPTVS